MGVRQGIFTVPKKQFELKRCSRKGKSNYKESGVVPYINFHNFLTFPNDLPILLSLSYYYFSI